MAADQTKLADLRREIDRIDDALHDLLMQRVSLTAGVVASKKGGIPLRPAREAAILRRLVARHTGPFPKAVVVRIWREIISANTALQGAFAIAALGSRESTALAEIAREYYGQLTSIQLFETPQSVLRAICDGRALVGFLPMPADEQAKGWWRLIARPGPGTPRVVGRLPFAQVAPPAVEALAVSLAPNEPTGHDRSYLVLATEAEVSRSTLNRRLAEAGLKAVEMHGDEQDGQRLQLVEVEGFHEEGSEAVRRLEEAEGIAQVQPIGGYAVPLMPAELESDKS